MKKIRQIALVALLCLSHNSTAGLIVQDLEISEDNLSFDISGNIDKIGTDYTFQLFMGLIDSTDNWLHYTNSSGLVANRSDQPNIDFAYTEPSFNLLLTVGDFLYVGDVIDYSFSFAGSFDVDTFTNNEFGITVGFEPTKPYLVQSELNIIDSFMFSQAAVPPVNSVDVSSPHTFLLCCLTLIMLTFTGRRLGN